MANSYVKTGDEVIASVNTDNTTALSDSIYLQNDITLTSNQALDLNAPAGSGNLRLRGGTPANYPNDGDPASAINYRLTVVNSLNISDTSADSEQPSFTIGPLTLRIGNGTTAGGIAGNLRLDDGGVLAFNRSADTTYTGTLTLEEEGNELRNEVSGTTVTLTGAAGQPSGVAIRASQGSPSSDADPYNLRIGGAGNGVINGVIADGGNSGVITKGDAGTWRFGATNTYSGGTTIDGGTLVLGAAGAAGTGDINFGTLTGTATARLTLETAAQPKGVTFANAIKNFGTGSELNLAGLTSASVSYNSTSSLLTVTGRSGGLNVSQSYNVSLADGVSGNAITAQSDGKGGTRIVVCYCSGTLIRTERGETAVENLAVGDRVVTASGEARPIRWIGTQTLDCRDHAKPGSVLPVRIAQGALGPNRPSRDLWVSPRHGLCLDLLGEVLIPADSLINGATITQERVESVTYWHIELDSHDLLIAEGVAAESYLDIGNRTFFTGPAGADAIPDAAGPDAALTRADCCRPFVESGSIITFVRERLRERAVALGWGLRPDPLAGLHLVADGEVIAPRVAGTTACFLLPAGCGDVRLVSGVSVPEHVTGTGGRRSLGVDLRGLTIDDGLSVRHAVPLDDARLGEGFHRAEGTGVGLHRWTKGDALLPASLWAECQDVFFLRLDLGGETLLRWHAPEGVTGQAALPSSRTAPRLRLVEAA